MGYANSPAHPAGVPGLEMRGWLREPLVGARPGPGDPQTLFPPVGAVGKPGLWRAEQRSAPLSPRVPGPKGRHGLEILRWGQKLAVGGRSPIWRSLCCFSACTRGTPSLPSQCTPGVQSASLFSELSGSMAVQAPAPALTPAMAAYGAVCHLPTLGSGGGPWGSLGNERGWQALQCMLGAHPARRDKSS